MKKTILPKEMRELEKEIMAKTHVTGEWLMQNAASRVADAVLSLCGENTGTVAVFCGCGNNGGDGLAALRMIVERSPRLQGLCLLTEGSRTADFVRELTRLQSLSEANRVDIRDYSPGCTAGISCLCAVDALFGTGLNRPPEGNLLSAVREINSLGVPVVSVDIPSGLNGADGNVPGEAVRAALTVTFHRPKPGLFLNRGPEYSGTVVTAPIGLPEWDEPDGFRIADEEDLAKWLPPRSPLLHKGKCGKLLIVAGSLGMSGAAALCATSALRTGAGLVRIACPGDILPILQSLCPCATCIPLPKIGAHRVLEKALRDADALAVGCGLGLSVQSRRIVRSLGRLLKSIAIPSVWDADALTLLSMEKALPPFLTAPVITPHPGEAARLLGTDIHQIIEFPEASAKALLDKFRGGVVLKGARSLLLSGGEKAINPFGSPAMAKGGSGDVLTGILGALLAGRAAGLYSISTLSLLQCGCALHGLAGEAAEREVGSRGVLATDLCSHLGHDFLARSTPRAPFFPAPAADEPLREAVPTEMPPESENPLGREVRIYVDKPAGLREDLTVYPLNCGFADHQPDTENCWQDAVVWGVRQPLEWYEGIVRGILTIDGRPVWLVSREELPSRAEIEEQCAFLGECSEIRLL